MSLFTKIRSALKQKRKLNTSLGFSLQEILIATAILGVIILIANRFMNISSRQSRIFSTRADSDMQYGLFKHQLIQDFKTPEIRNIGYNQNDPYTFTLRDNNNNLLFRFECGCVSENGVQEALPNYVRVAESQAPGRTTDIETSLNNAMDRWISQSSVYRPFNGIAARRCNQGELPRVIRTDSNGVITNYPMANTPVNYVDNGGVIASRIYMTNQPGSTVYYAHIFKASLKPRANDSSSLAGINWTSNVVVSHDFIKFDLASNTVDVPSFPHNNDDSEPSSSDPSSSEPISEPPPSSEPPSSEPHSSEPPSSEPPSSEPPPSSEEPKDCASRCPYYSTESREYHAAVHMCQHTVGFDPFVGCQIRKPYPEPCEEVCVAPEIFFNGADCTFSLLDGVIFNVPPECEGHQGKVITKIGDVSCTPGKYDGIISMSYGIGNVKVSFADGTDCTIDYDRLITKPSYLYRNTDNPAKTFIPYYVRTCDCLMASVYYAPNVIPNMCENGWYFSDRREAAPDQTCQYYRDIGSELFQVFDADILYYYVSGQSGETARCYIPAGPSCLTRFIPLPTPP